MGLKSLIKSTLIASTALVTAGAGALYLLHQISSKQVIERIKNNLGSDAVIITTWVEPLFQKVIIDEQPTWALVGGVTTVEDDAEAQYHFVASATTGQLLDIQKI
ncbi:hypothetical protein HU830_06940 [Lactobacillus sp. DCY120]|uniref:PepSY domain-containing protein n=1 Tax=Bombilactobacillus apium TaxID=2675299 RepID=A0A850QYG7_9LACO|nr:hypothetical protein [Bombilactobacillus apium]NVY96884.1 hypothetical protein [Bombilactobacillus apium]